MPLFSSKKKSEIPDPYAQPPAPSNFSQSSYGRPGSSQPPSYAPSARSQPPSYAPSQRSYRGDPAPPQQQAPQNGYGGYGNQNGGYGGQQGGPSSSYGRSAEPRDDPNRRQLFANAPAPRQDFASGNLDDLNDAAARYGGRPDDEVLGQSGQGQDEEEEVEAIKQQIRFTKQESVASTRNALRAAAEAEAVANGTLDKLGEQSERLARVEQHLDMAKAYKNRAEDDAKQIKALNRSIFIPNIQFNKEKKRQAEEQRLMDRHLEEKAEREQTRRDVEAKNKIMENTYRDNNRKPFGNTSSAGKKGLTGRSKYQFEADEEDDEMENEIDGNLDELSAAASRLNNLAKAQGSIIGQQNETLGRTVDKAAVLDEDLVRGTHRMKMLK